MGKQTTQDLATILVEKNGLEKKEAQRFVTAIFEVIQDGIDRDKLVKIKGLGTFKVVGVEARESVNVNTGERVMIDSHAKITFTPDTTMRELVNKPFSSFDTVVLNDGVAFDDMASSLAALDTDPEQEQAEETEQVEDLEPIQEDEPVQETKDDTQVIDHELTQEEPLEDQPANDEDTEEEVEEETLDNKDKPMEDVENYTGNPEYVVGAPVPKKQWWKKALAILAFGGACFGGGFYLGNHSLPPSPFVDVIEGTSAENEIKERQSADSIEEAKSDSLRKARLKADSIKRDSMLKDSLKRNDFGLLSGKPQQVPAQPAPAKPQSEPVKAKPQPSTGSSAVYMKYDAMDERVRLGAYYIMGQDHVVQAKEGETLQQISRRILGPGMECYLEVFNGIKAKTPLKAGQTIKIPKLETKKSVNNRMKQQ